jgi:hypothetical protein
MGIVAAQRAQFGCGERGVAARPTAAVTPGGESKNCKQTIVVQENVAA